MNLHNASSTARDGELSQLTAILILNSVKGSSMVERSKVKCVVGYVMKENDVTFLLWDFLITYPVPAIFISVVCS